MATEFTMPQLGLTMTEGTVLKWLKSVGDKIALGDLLVEVETDKINYQVESTLEGDLLQILVPEGTAVAVKVPLAVIGKAGEMPKKIEASPEPPIKPVSAPAPGPEVPIPAPPRGPAGETRLFASPIARRIAREQNLSLEKISGSGPDGRIVERDVLKHLDQGKVKASPLAEKIAGEFKVDLKTLEQETRIMKEDVLAQLARTPGSAGGVPISGMRKVIAERMSRSWQTAPHVNMTAEVDMTAATDLKDKLTQGTGKKVSFTDIVVKCTAQALTEFPLVNASLIEGKIVTHESVHIGIAVALDNGLIVPVIRNVQQKTITAIREDVASLSTRARSGGLSAEELSGGTFTVTNLGMFGVDHFTPIINPPESAILGVCRIVDRPMVRDGAVVVRPMMNLCLSFDHRLVDGAVGAQFLARVRQLLEEPLLLL